MKLVERAKNVLLSPKTEWDAIAADATPTATLVTGYVLPLAAVAAVAHFIGLVLIGQSMGPLGTIRMSMTMGLVSLVFQLVMSVVMVFVVGFIVDALAPSFGGQKNMNQAVKVAAYCYTPVWVVGILAILPMLGLLGIIAGLYAIYLLYLGLTPLMKAPQEKAAGYTAVVVLAAIVIGIVVAMVGGMISAPAMLAGGMATRSAPSVTFDKSSPMGKLEDFGKKMEQAGKRMEAAQKTGDSNKQMEAAMGALGTVLSGGKGVEPLQLDALKPFLPETLAGLPRTASSSDRSGVAGLMVAKVEADYSNASGKRLELEVVDTGGAAGLMGLAGWAMAGTRESENDQRIERMYREGARMVREQVSKRGGSNEYAVILADRFVVSAKGRGVDFGTVKSAVNSIDLGKIESLK